jgi:hypothetical protein
MARLPTHEKTSHIWGVFPLMARLPMHGKTSVPPPTHPSISEDLPLVGSLPIDGKRGSLPIFGKPSHLWGNFPYLGSLPMYGKSSHIWEVFPYIGSLPIDGKSAYS